MMTFSKDYKMLPKISFDYEVVEKVNQIVAIPYEGYLVKINEAMLIINRNKK